MKILGHDFATEYSVWLRSQIKSARQGDRVQVSTPFLDVFNDGIRVYVEKGTQGLILHDDGLTLESLACVGVQVSERRGSIIGNVLAGGPVRLFGERLEVMASFENLPQRMHFLITAILRINDLWMTATPHSSSNFLQLVCEFLDEHDVSYSRNVSIPGRTIEHPIDLLINFPKGRERLIKVLGTPDTNQAKLISFTWTDIQTMRPESDRTIILNDTDLETAEEKPVPEKALAILNGYSNSVYRWSHRKDVDFSNVWKSAA